MPALQWWPAELTLQPYFVNLQDPCFERLHCPCTVLFASSAVSNRRPVAIISKKTHLGLKKYPLFKKIIHYACRTQCSYAGASNIVAGGALVSRRWQSRVPHPFCCPLTGCTPEEQHWVSLAGHCAPGTGGWPGDSGCWEHSAGSCPPVQRGNHWAFSSRVALEFVWRSILTFSVINLAEYFGKLMLTPN